MEEKIIIALLSGTTRTRRQSITAAQYVAAIGQSYPNIEIIFIDPTTFNFPVLGSCWGAQFLAHIFGGAVETIPEKEELGSYLAWPTTYADDDPLFYDAPQGFWAQIGHHQSITKLPEGAVNLVSTERCEIQAFTWLGSRVYGLQFHSDLNKDELIERVDHYRDNYAPDQAAYNAFIDCLKDSPYTDNLVARFIDRIVLSASTA